MASAERQPLHTRDSQTQRRRSMGVNLGRFLAERCSTPIWWRSARFSNSRAARERKIEDKVAKRVAKEMSIGGENYDSTIIPVRSDISRFSRGTVYFTAPPLGMLLAAQVYLWLRGTHAVFCAKLHHDNDKRCIFRCNYKALLTPITLKETM
jgi:hypothetical protein